MEVTQKPFNRKKPEQLVYLELGSGNGGMLLSLSEEGFRFRAVSPLRPNGLMPFAFSFDGSQRLQGIGEVEWLEDDAKSGGMRFVEVSAEFRSALETWLALESPHGTSGREATPAAATPLDTMEKIREELRRGYPQQPGKPSPRTEPPPPARPETPERKAAEPRPQPANPVRPPPPVRTRTAEPVARREEPQERTPAFEAPAVPHEPVSQPRERQERPDPDRGRVAEERPQPFYPPPFTHRAEPETPAAEKPGSAFLKHQAPLPAPPAESRATRSGFPALEAPAEPAASEAVRSRDEAHASAETLRRPFRGEPRPAPSERPYVPPPVDESFEAAWERAKLTAPPESPHLSRAAAGSIIGIALAVILGALAFNFRQEIGELVITLGQTISGGHPAAPSPPAATDGKANPAEGSTTETGSSPEKPDAASGTAGAGSQPATSPNRPADSRAAASRTAQEVPSETARDAAGTANHAPNGAAGNSARANPAESASEPAASLIGSEPGSGQDEFNAAREMLKADRRHRDISRAVDLLWAGVRKGYVPAEVTLADLYRRGDGVEKNCDQAQVLLVAASKKGSPEARQMLELMAEQGCRD